MTSSQIMIAVIVPALVKILVMIGFVFNVGALLTWLDRRQGAMIQDRVGPNRAVLKIGKFELRAAGLLHTAADGLKFFFKEDFMPPKADKLLFSLAPMVVMIPVLAILAVIPFGDTVCPQSLWRIAKNGHLIFPAVARDGVCGADPANNIFPIPMQIATLNVGILYVFALSGQGIVGAALAGYSSDNKFSLMGALRAASQMVSYEVVLGMSLIGAFMIYGTLRIDDMVRWQGQNTWGIFVQPLTFFVFFAAAVAESKRIPFDLPEAESELVSGYFTEYSGMKFGMFYFAEYMEVATSSMLLVTIFLGGWNLPFLHRDGLTISFGTNVLFQQMLPHIWVTIFQVLAFFGKVLLLCWFQCFVRWSLPRFRYDQLMKLCWKVLLPISLANIFVTGVTFMAIDKSGPDVTSALKLVADVTQAIVAILITYYVVRGVVGWFRPSKHATWLVGSSANQADGVGGTKETPMQA
jgi:NADH-quinone oxidoreductase subunit H